MVVRRRAAALAAVVVAVLVAHACVVREVSRHVVGMPLPEPGMQRLTAVYTRTMAPAEPVAAAKAPPKRKPRPRPAAEAPGPAAPAVAELPEARAEPVKEPEPEVAEAPASSPDVAAVSPEPDSGLVSGDSFQWPEATRITYDLTGNYRGPIHGDAKVEWVRRGDVYQMHLDVSVGPSLVPFMSRRMSSMGRITADGLRPERYEQETKLPFSTPTRAVVLLEPDHIQLANGQWRERWPSVQDTASQFVQLAWRFTTQPELLVPGATISVPLAMPRAVQEMLYEVSEREALVTPFGEVGVYRLTPKLVPRAGGDLSVEMWLAPQYRYLPLRLKIHQDAETYVDLMITSPPELPGDG